MWFASEDSTFQLGLGLELRLGLMFASEDSTFQRRYKRLLLSRPHAFQHPLQPSIRMHLFTSTPPPDHTTRTFNCSRTGRDMSETLGSRREFRVRECVTFALLAFKQG